jgi:outer membrane receptor protein involved in Fe transport
MKFFIVLLSVLFIPCVSEAQQAEKGSLSGAILDSNGEPIQFATVKIQSLGIGSISDTLGNFHIDDIPYGTHEITVSSFGQIEKKQTISIEGKKQKLNISMEHDSVHEVVIVAKTEERQIQEQGYAVNVIETKDVELQSIQANDLLDRSAGVRVRQTGGLGSTVQYNINGLSGNSVRIFIDGIPIANYGPSFSLNSIPTTMIERIEVYKGVVPAYLSDDALGGAVNIILKKSMKNTLNTSYSFGSFNTHQFNVNGAYRHDSSGFTARASGFYNYTDNSYKVWGDKVTVTDPNTFKVKEITAKRFHDKYESIGGKFDIGFTDVKWADQFLIGAVLSDMKKEIQHGATMEIVYGNRHTVQKTQLYSVLYSKRNFLTKGLNVNFFSSYSNLKRGTIDTIPYMFNWYGEQLTHKWSSGAEGGSPTLQTNLEKNFTARTNLTYEFIKNHSINLNYIYTTFTRDQDDAMLSQPDRDMVDRRYLTKSILSAAYESKFFNQRLKSSLFIKYYNQEVRLNDKVKNSRGEIVVNNYDKIVSIPGYGLAMSYTIVRNVMLTASAEKAVRLPEATEIFGNNAENINPSYALKPERSNNFNIGFNLGTFKLKKHNIGLVTNFFYRNTADMIRQGVPTPVSETYQFENLLSVLSKGFDTELIYNFHQKLFLTSGMSVFNARFNTEFDQGGNRYIYYQNRLRNSPYLTSNTNVRYYLENVIQKKSLMSFYYNFAYVHEFFRDWEGIGKNNKPTIPTQLVHDFGIAYTFPKRKITVSFDAKNILNRQVFDNWALQKPGRAFYIKFTYKII